MEILYDQKEAYCGFSILILHCFNCRPSDSTAPEDAEIEPGAVSRTALRSNQSTLNLGESKTVKVAEAQITCVLQRKYVILLR